MNKLKRTGNKVLPILIAYFLIYVVWGATYYFIGLALKDFPPFLLGTFRFSIAGILLLLFCFLRGESIFKKSLIKKSIFSGIVLLFIDMAVVMIAQQYISSSLVAIIAASTALWIMAFDVPMWKNNFQNPITIVGIVLGFLGVLMLYVEQYFTETTNSNHSFGIIILVLGCISWALGTLYTKYYSSNEEDENSFSGSAWQMIFASMAFLFCSIMTKETDTVQLKSISMNSWYSLLYLIFFGSLLAYSAYIWLLKIRPASEVGTHAFVNPVVAIFFGVTFGNENVTVIQIIGLGIIIISVVLVSRNKSIKLKKDKQKI